MTSFRVVPNNSSYRKRGKNLLYNIYSLNLRSVTKMKLLKYILLQGEFIDIGLLGLGFEFIDIELITTTRGNHLVTKVIFTKFLLTT